MHNYVFVLLLSRSLVLALIYRSSLFQVIFQTTFILHDLRLRSVSLAHKQRTVAILLAAQIFAKSENILRRVLVHRRIGCRANHNHSIRSITHSDESHTEQRSVEQARSHILVIKEKYSKRTKHHQTYNNAESSMTIERHTEQCHAQEERNIHAHLAHSLSAFNQSPNERSNQQSEVCVKTRVVSQAHAVYKHQLEPSAHLHNARNNTIENSSNKQRRHTESHERTLQVRILALLVVEHKHDGRDTKQVQQVHTD